MTTADELWGRVQAAEAAERTARAAVREFGSFHPDSWSPEAEAARDAEHEAWLDGEEARHELDAFLNPERYAAKGYRAEALDEFRARAEGNGGSVQPDAEISDDLWAGVAPDVEAGTEADAHANAEVAAEIMAHDLTTMLDEYGMEPGGDDPEFPGARSLPEPEIEIEPTG